MKNQNSSRFEYLDIDLLVHVQNINLVILDSSCRIVLVINIWTGGKKSQMICSLADQH